MAFAIVTGIEQAYIESNTPKVQVGVIFRGSDVPGSLQKQGLLVDLTAVTDDLTLSAAIAAEVKTHAANNGYAVSTVLLPFFKTV